VIPGISRIKELIMGLSAPTPPSDDAHAGAAWADTPADVVLEQAHGAAAGGDLPRARALIESVVRRPGLSAGEQIDAWALALEVRVLDGDHDGAGDAVDQLARLATIGDVRQRIRMVWLRHPGDAELENRLLQRAERAASAGDAARAATDPAEGQRTAAAEPAPSIQALLASLKADDGEEDEAPGLADGPEHPGEPDPEALLLFTEGPGAFSPQELRGTLAPERVGALVAEEDSGDLPLLEGTALAERSPSEIHVIVAEHPGASGRELLRRYAREQALRTSPDELQHSYDMAVEIFGQDRWEEAAHLLFPVAAIDNPERLGALELLARSLFELDRLPQAEAYLKEAVPQGRALGDPGYAPLFYWLAQICEQKAAAAESEGGDPGEFLADAIDYYTAARRLDPTLVEARRRLQVLLQL
jgi:tetratricopeptide (TPR) repeat protein